MVSRVALKNLRKKLHPRNFTNMSPKMMAIVGYMIGDETLATPVIEEMLITSDGFVFARVAGDIGANEMIGAYDDLKRNWNALLQAADLTTAQKRAANTLFNLRVYRF